MLLVNHACGNGWESSNQKECLHCKNQLTDNEIKEIKNIPLQERVVIILEKTITLFGRTILEVASPLVVPVTIGAAAGVAIGATAEVTNAVVAGVAYGATASAVGVALPPKLNTHTGKFTGVTTGVEM